MRAVHRRSSNGFVLAAAFVAMLGALAGCGVGPEARAAEPPAASSPNVAQDEWPAGSTDERIRAVAAHIGGFSAAMMEVGYRHNEMYWAGQESNWRLAEYHAAKIGDAIQKGIERRPGRAESAQRFLNETLPTFRAALEREDRGAFADAYASLTRGCNGCHAAEDVEFITVRTPERRIYPVHAP